MSAVRCDKDNFTERNGSNVTEVRPHLSKAAMRKGCSCVWGLRERPLVRAAQDRLDESWKWSVHWHGVRSHFISWTIQDLSQSAPTNNSSTLDLFRRWYACNLGAKYSSWARVKKKRKKTAPKKIRVLTTKFSALRTCRASHRLAPYASAATSRSGRPSAWRSRHSANDIWWPRGISLFQFDVRLWAGDLIAILATEW